MENLNSLISIILTSYNHDNFLSESIESILSQTYENFELIIWDDNSGDNSYNIAKKYNDNRIRLFKNSKNKGASYGVNKAIFNEVKGDYICVTHSDDVWRNTKLEDQLKCFFNKNISAVFCKPELIDEHGYNLKSHELNNLFISDNKSSHRWLEHLFYNGNFLCHPSVMIKKECYLDLGGYHEQLLQLPDYDFWIRLLSKFEIYILDKPLIKFRVHSDLSNTSANIESVRLRSIFELELVTERFLSILTNDNIFNIFPNLHQYKNRPNNIKFLYAMACIDPRAKFYHWHNALRTLYILFCDNTTKDFLARNYNFNINDYYKLSGNLDYYSQVSLTSNNQQISILNTQLNILNNEIDCLKKDIRILNSGN